MKPYGNPTLTGGFEKILEISEDGFYFDGTGYRWSDIKKIKRHDSFFWSFFFNRGGAPLSYVLLNDGKRIKLQGRILQQEGKPLDVGFVSGYSTAYKELIDFLTAKTAT